ncbi:MAG: helix-turn-helix transcriptional regulator [Lachnospiraceae bacterium]|nr:helix-turn-helix transcriptional regulator [Lachnospiraceae bacterium]
MKKEEDSCIDVEQTGKWIKYCLKEAGYSVKEVQEYLHLACPQSIYRWFQGKMLPTVEHLYSLSKLLGVHMEELIKTKDDISAERVVLSDKNKRLFIYWKRLKNELLVDNLNFMCEV